MTDILPNQKDQGGTKLDYNSMYKRENTLYGLTVSVLPIFIFALLLYFFEYIPSFPNGYFSVLLFVLIVYVIGFVSAYYKTPSIPKNAKRDKIQTILRKFGYEKIVLRQNFFNKYKRVSIITLITISIIVGFGYQLLTEQIISNNIEYLEKEKEFNNEHNRVEKMNHDELIIFLNKEISGMYYPYQYEMFLRDIALAEIINFEEGELISQDLSNLSASIESISKEETISFVQQKVANLEDDKLLKSAKIIINYSEPRKIFYDNSEFYRLQNFLLGILFIPIMMMYGNYLVRGFLERSYEYNYHLTIGCFCIIQKFPELNEKEKRHYTISAIYHYNKYFMKTLNQRIQNINKITSALLVKSPTKIIKNATSSIYHLEHSYDTKLLCKLEKEAGNNDPATFFVNDSIRDKIKEAYPFIIPTISAIIASLSLLL